MDPKWLQRAKSLQTMAQTGLTYASDPYDIERYKTIQAMALEMMAEQSQTDPEIVKDLFQYELGHATPKIDVRAAIFQQEQVLLVRERSDGCWTLPGGWADVGESAAEATAREVREEAGYEVRITRLLALYDREKHDHPPHPYYAYKVFFACEISGGQPMHSSETDGVDFFPLEELPPLSLTRVTGVEIARLFELYQNPALGADFD